MKRMLAVLMFAGLAAFAHGQQTAVTATVVDSDGTAWANGTCSAFYLPVPSSPGPLVNSATGQVLAPNPVSCTLSATGVLSLTLPETRYVFGPNQVQGNSPGVVFSVCPEMGSPCYSSSTVVISGASQDVSAQINAKIQAPRILGVTPWVKAYNDTEVAAVEGNCYYNLTSGTTRNYTTASGWADGCGGGGGTGTIGGTVSDKSIPMGTAADTLGNSPMSVDNSASPTKITSTVPLSSKGFFPGSVTEKPYLNYYEHFLIAVNGTTIASGAIGSPTGQSCAGSNTASTAAHPGILVLTSGTGGTGTGITCNAPPGNAQIAGLATNPTPFRLEFDINIPVLPGTTAGAYQLGIVRTINNNPWPAGNAAGFYLSSANSVANDWYCNAGATAGFVDSGVAATTGWVALDLKSDGANVHFYIDGAEVCGTGIPIAQFNTMTSNGSISMTTVALSGTSVVMNVDYVLFQYQAAAN